MIRELRELWAAHTAYGDARAARMLGLEVAPRPARRRTARRAGWGTRTYRDRRFDALRVCGVCAGSGVLVPARPTLACDAVPCTRCQGTGVVRLASAAARDLAGSGVRP